MSARTIRAKKSATIFEEREREREREGERERGMEREGERERWFIGEHLVFW